MNNEEKILAMLEQLQQGQTRTDARFDKVDSHFDKVDSRLNDIEQRVTSLELTQENVTNKSLNLISEGIETIIGKLNRIDKLEDNVENHDTRIWALEQAVKAK